MNQEELTEEAVRNAIALIAAAGNEDQLGGDLILAGMLTDSGTAQRALVMLASMCAELLSTLCGASGQDPNELLHACALQLAEENK